ncbi:bifunctional tRNA (5-methylaminomethyl-2-thiouridine)(34)-methyltransferase MnmD/FAD-dependent 5-carboxymethylaminomethyl-2-thiouridine(34) oxidoreductase MnmC [Photobacterium sp. 2_MG-2023]|uniref:bifunctional tRNA (5-methylaminomethyl-2-thiouridine)(34)-methyltransferase MnmD/FAD-dependent 5-carboxymethylaminomethyl-2-thiouridine(34) oxidoreductase MnmC n=1 Tax=Photobacterium sp. 2_MG-2023 TaxID=3062663 RepID=UPI0026E48760|nr:bifunctional tRNA (5-methylaminomethyl-2-thiouridine)(34)-methyltransferase MnmD/FAD-dependent 5-carboxymethylaminomethyl-2-thiouridine(34) oxidoreductase MnmC [Photobacterium sp. 2_MG-2023]MDO6579760.1 bifunctional tRNA (5-methylaminomethyl-2-thiouridine)(34)-methyltransferase MnmD/FAD-dependent 5-carboxymethylaminomethyl-2-thiouridine(34) oxidoreductase MnmC [Photobacterium sp. 2_MG-2023]
MSHSSPKQIENAVLDWNEAGTPVSHDFDDVYFSNANGLEETRYVFLQQNGLPTRWDTFDRRRFVVAETGFGTGLNFLAVWQWFKAFRQANPDASVKELHFISFEKFPVTRQDLIKAHESWPELADLARQLHAHYPPAVADCHRLVLEDGMITLDLWFGDIKTSLPQVWTPAGGLVDAWFLDGFAPSKNPEMWNQDLFNGMAALAREACTAATFTAAGFVRRGLNDAGFDMKKVKGFGYKRDMLAGTLSERRQGANFAPWYARQSAADLSDVAIIGGGIGSAATALALVRRGVQVSLYCADALPAEGASGNRQGAVYPLLNGSNDALSRFFAPAYLYARQFVEQAAAVSDFSHDWCGVTQLAWNEKTAEKLDKMLSGGFPQDVVHALDVEQTQAITGVTTGHRSVHYPLGGWLCPQALTRALIQQAQATGRLSLHTDTDITSLSQNDSPRWSLISRDNRQFIHSTVVVANGHRFAEFAQTRDIPAYSVRGQVSHVPSQGELAQLKSVLCYDGYLTPVNPDTQTHCIGASYRRNSTDLSFSPEEHQDNQTRLAECLPAVDWPTAIDVSAQDARTGVRCASRDHLPFVGDVCRFETLLSQYAELREQQSEAADVPVYSGLYAMIGLGSRGLSSAPLLGEVLASQLCGDPLPLPLSVLDALHPGRMWVRKLLKGKAVES